MDLLKVTHSIFSRNFKVEKKAQPIDPDLTAKLLGRGVATSPIVTVEPRRRKFHKAITLSMPAPKAHSQGMINQYSGSAPTLRLLCSITGGPSRAQWEDVTGSTPLTFVNDCVSFTTTVSARFWLMDCRNIADATKMATELYREAIHVPFMAKFVVFAKRVDPLEARLRVFCMTDDKEDKTLEHQEYFTEVAKSRDVEVLEGKAQYIEMAGNLVPVTKSGEQLQLPFKAFRENRLPFSVRVKDQHADTVGRALFMREPKVAKGEPPQQPICILNIVLPEDIMPDFVTSQEDGIDSSEVYKRLMPDGGTYLGDLRVVDMSNLLGEDWLKLAPEIGVSEVEVEEIVEQHPNSTAQQAQAMLRLYLMRRNNDRNILENGLKAIQRDDIVKRCMRSNYIEANRQDHVSRRHISLDGSPYEESDLMKDSESIEELVQTEDNRLKQLHEREEMKYSAEEKIIEDEESEEDEVVKRSVAERRQQIEKRLSVERQIPASTQKKEIVEEITTIKRHSLIEDKKARHEEEILAQTPVENVIKPVALPEPVLKLKSGNLKEGSDLDKTEFDRELKDKFKSTGKSVEEDFEELVDSKIHIDSKVTEKTVTDRDGDVITTCITTTKTTTIVDEEPQIVTFTATDSLQDKLRREELEKEASVPRKTTFVEPQLAEKIETSSRFVDDLIGDAAETVDAIKRRDHGTKIVTEEVCIERAANDITLSQTPPPTPELQFQRDPLEDRRGIQFQDDTTTSSVQDDASVDTEMFREDHFGSLDPVTKRKAVYWASAEDFDALSMQSSEVDDKRATPSDITAPSSSDNQRRRSQQKAQFNLRFEETAGDSQTTSIGTSPITNLVESPEAPRSGRTDSPSLKLVIGRKELKTSDASAISESRLTLYGTQDVEISISSQSKISVTTTHSTSTSSSAGERDTPRKQRKEKVFESEETFGRDGKKREESVVFSNKKSIHLYGSFDSNSESPATEHSYSHHITDTGISLTRGTFTETATSPGIQATSDNANEKGRLALITDTALDVEVEELELTDAGLSPIQPDDQDLVNIGFQMAAEEDIHFSNMATSPVEFDASSSAVDTSEAGTLTDQVVLKDASSSPLDANTSLRQDLSKLKEEDILMTRRGSGDVKAKVKMLEESVLKSSLSQSSSPKKKSVTLPKESKEPPQKPVSSDERTDSSNEDESAVSEEPIPPIHEMIMQIEKRIADESTSRTTSDPRSPLKRSTRSTKVPREKVSEATILGDLEEQIIKPSDTTDGEQKESEQDDQRRISKLIYALENKQKFDEIDAVAQNLQEIHEPVCEVKLTKKTISQLTDTDEDVDEIEKLEDPTKSDTKKHVYFSESVQDTKENKSERKSSKIDTHSTFKTIEFASNTLAVVDFQNIVTKTESCEARDEMEKVHTLEKVQTKVTETTDHTPAQKIFSQIEKSEITEKTKHTESVANQQTIKTTATTVKELTSETATLAGDLTGNQPEGTETPLQRQAEVENLCTHAYEEKRSEFKEDIFDIDLTKITEKTTEQEVTTYKDIKQSDDIKTTMIIPKEEHDFEEKALEKETVDDKPKSSDASPKISSLVQTTSSNEAPDLEKTEIVKQVEIVAQKIQEVAKDEILKVEPTSKEPSRPQSSAELKEEVKKVGKESPKEISRPESVASSKDEAPKEPEPISEPTKEISRPESVASVKESPKETKLSPELEKIVTEKTEIVKQVEIVAQKIQEVAKDEILKVEPTSKEPSRPQSSAELKEEVKEVGKESPKEISRPESVASSKDEAPKEPEPISEPTKEISRPESVASSKDEAPKEPEPISEPTKEISRPESVASVKETPKESKLSPELEKIKIQEVAKDEILKVEPTSKEPSRPQSSAELKEEVKEVGKESPKEISRPESVASSKDEAPKEPEPISEPTKEISRPESVASSKDEAPKEPEPISEPTKEISRPESVASVKESPKESKLSPELEKIKIQEVAKDEILKVEPTSKEPSRPQSSAELKEEVKEVGKESPKEISRPESVAKSVASSKDEAPKEPEPISEPTKEISRPESVASVKESPKESKLSPELEKIVTEKTEIVKQVEIVEQKIQEVAKDEILKVEPTSKEPSRPQSSAELKEEVKEVGKESPKEISRPESVASSKDEAPKEPEPISEPTKEISRPESVASSKDEAPKEPEPISEPTKEISRPESVASVKETPKESKLSPLGTIIRRAERRVKEVGKESPKEISSIRCIRENSGAISEQRISARVRASSKDEAPKEPEPISEPTKEISRPESVASVKESPKESKLSPELEKIVTEKTEIVKQVEIVEQKIQEVAKDEILKVEPTSKEPSRPQSSAELKEEVKEVGKESPKEISRPESVASSKDEAPKEPEPISEPTKEISRPESVASSKDEAPKEPEPISEPTKEISRPESVASVKETPKDPIKIQEVAKDEILKVEPTSKEPSRPQSSAELKEEVKEVGKESPKEISRPESVASSKDEAPKSLSPFRTTRISASPASSKDEAPKEPEPISEPTKEISRPESVASVKESPKESKLSPELEKIVTEKTEIVKQVEIVEQKIQEVAKDEILKVEPTSKEPSRPQSSAELKEEVKEVGKESPKEISRPESVA
ncbi:microtubule-associated protein futsch-like, partial [Phlebotomus argentipes]|uniref:microtubule-associated protein futsch-like n=1 Tax=Phlebotomus argentipes TaxID=94469 RepID=UPI002892C7D2